MIPIELTARSIRRGSPGKNVSLPSELSTQSPAPAIEESVAWDPGKTALVICDMWREHWCKGAARRVAEFAPRAGQVAASLRERGVFIVHAPGCPDDDSDFYKDWPGRRLARAAPAVEIVRPACIPPPGWEYVDVVESPWAAPNLLREGLCPIYDSTGAGCDCKPRCVPHHHDIRQVEAIEIKPDDAIVGGLETIFVLRERQIENVLILGVHLNVCMVGRPYGIRNLVYQNFNVILIRDLTDSLYDPRNPPYVSHSRGTEMMTEHLETFWCRTVTSDQIVDGGDRYG